MKGTLTTIKVDGTTSVEEVASAHILDKLQAAVGGSIETVRYFHHYEDKRAVAFLNEEGKIHGLPYNSLATNLWLRAMRGRPLFDTVFGNMVIVQGDDEFMEAL